MYRPIPNRVSKRQNTTRPKLCGSAQAFPEQTLLRFHAFDHPRLPSLIGSAAPRGPKLPFLCAAQVV